MLGISSGINIIGTFDFRVKIAFYDASAFIFTSPVI
jgi:hypothetical protein